MFINMEAAAITTHQAAEKVKKMKAQLPIFYNKEHLTLPQTSTARLTNSVNRTAYNSFNKWGGLTFEDILSNYPRVQFPQREVSLPSLSLQGCHED